MSGEQPPQCLGGNKWASAVPDMQERIDIE
jgi:hypothetical protein